MAAGRARSRSDSTVSHSCEGSSRKPCWGTCSAARRRAKSPLGARLASWITAPSAGAAGTQVKSRDFLDAEDAKAEAMMFSCELARTAATSSSICSITSSTASPMAQETGPPPVEEKNGAARSNASAIAGEQITAPTGWP